MNVHIYTKLIYLKMLDGSKKNTAFANIRFEIRSILIFTRTSKK